MSGIGTSSNEKISRIDLEAPLTWVILAAAFGFILTWLLPMISGGFLGGIMAVVFSFFCCCFS